MIFSKNAIVIQTMSIFETTQYSTRMNKQLLLGILSLVLSTAVSAQKGKTAVATDLNAHFKAAKWRSIGPFRGGRSVTATGVTSDPSTYYMGTTGGGLWKTQDMGVSWFPISDGFFKTTSVGAISGKSCTSSHDLFFNCSQSASQVIFGLSKLNLSLISSVPPCKTGINPAI